MEFLESLYSIENFGIYLFVVIGILVVLFLIILFFGKKDEQKRKEEKKNEETPTSEALFKETTVPTPVEVPIETPAVPVVEPIPTEIPMKEEIESKEEEVPIAEKEFDFDALAAAISKELESIENNTVPVVEEVKPVEEIKPVEPVLSKVEEAPIHYQVFEPVEEKVVEPQFPEKKEEPVAEPTPIPSISEEPKKMARPTVFSSVYVNRNVEEPKIREEQRVMPEVKAIEEAVTPVAPKIELPKMMDLPKKK